MPSHRFLLPVLICLGLLAAPAVRAQWVVYDARVTPVMEVSENFSPYTGIYFIAPVSGGNASMVFLTEEGGRFYNVAENSARYFIAAGDVGRLATLSAVSFTGTARAMYQCVGMLNSTLSYNVNGQRQGGRVSTDMLGTMLAADDESEAPAPGSNGSLGMVGTAQIKATLRIDLSRILNSKELGMSQAVVEIVSLLEKYGYQPDDGSAEPAPAEPAAPQQQPVSQPQPLSPAQPQSQPKASTPLSPQPAPAPANDGSDAISIFPPGAMEEMERSLKEPLGK